MKISAHVTRISTQVTGQNRVGSCAYDFTRALSSAVRPTACTNTVTATRMKAMRISESTIRVWPRQTLADKDLMSKSDMGLGTLDCQLCSLNGSFTKIGAATGKVSSRKSDTQS